MLRISLVLAILFGFNSQAFSQEESPHFFRGKPEMFFQKTEPMVFFQADLAELFFEMKKSARSFLKPRIFFPDNIRFPKFLGIKKIKIEIQFVFTEENK